MLFKKEMTRKLRQMGGGCACAAKMLGGVRHTKGRGRRARHHKTRKH